MSKNICCFLGHRKIAITDEQKKNLCNIIKNLIVNENVDTFLFGSKSLFNDLCYQIIRELKNDYPHIKRIYVRAQFPYINDDYKNYLLEKYEETYYPTKILKAGKSVYVQRNYEMINKSKFCIMYFDENYTPPEKTKSDIAPTGCQSKSGTKIAYDYALKKQKIIINIFDNCK